MNSLFLRRGAGMLLAGAVLAVPALAADGAGSMQRLNGIGERSAGSTGGSVAGAAGDASSGNSSGSLDRLGGAGTVGGNGNAGRSADLPAAPAHQLTQQFTPQAQYQLARREAYAAYEEMVRRCRQTSGADRSACMQEARGYLRDDLAFAREHLQGAGAVGASGASSSASGSGRGGPAMAR